MQVPRPRRLRALLLLTLLPLSLATAAPGAGASTSASIRVTTTVDAITADGRCSLREAIRSANLDLAVGGCVAGHGADTIVLAPGTFPLTIAGVAENAALTGDLDLTGQLTIRGAGAPATLVDGRGLDRVFHVQAGARVILDAISVLHGLASAGASASVNAGAGISNHGNLTITNSRITHNETSAGGLGGGIFNSAMLTVRDTTIDDNVADLGGGIYSTGSAYLVRVRVNDNVAYGRDSHAPYALTDNVSASAPRGGGAGGITAGGYLSVARSWITGNSGGDEWGHGGISMERGIVIDTTIAGNSGSICGTGGIVIVGGILERSAVIGNSNGSCGPGAGGVYSIDGQILNSTISGNRADMEYVVAGVKAIRGSIVSSTITANINSRDGGETTGGPAGLEGERTFVRNTIVAGNAGNAGYPSYSPGGDAVGTFVSNGHNLFGSTAGWTGAISKTDRVKVDPKLGPLAYNGGQTMTHSLMPGSPAIDAWYDRSVGASSTCPALDQRGVRRPVDGNGDGVALCDIGALERTR